MDQHGFWCRAALFQYVLEPHGMVGGRSNAWHDTTGLEQLPVHFKGWEHDHLLGVPFRGNALKVAFWIAQVSTRGCLLWNVLDMPRLTNDDATWGKALPKAADG